MPLFKDASATGVAGQKAVLALEAADLNGPAVTEWPRVAMMADVSGGYTASASSTYAYNPFYAFDKNWVNVVDGTAWISALTYTNGAYTGAVTTTVSGSSVAGEWLQIQLPVAIVITAHSLAPRFTFSHRLPISYVLAGSNDGATWTTVDSRTGISSGGYADNTLTPFAVTPPAIAYSYYRLISRALSANAAANTANIGEWTLTGALTSSAAVPSWGGFAQATPGNRPVYVATGGLNNTGYVSFTGASSQFLDAGPRRLNIATNGGFTAVVHMRFNAGNAYERLFAFGSAGTDTNSVQVMRWTNPSNINFRMGNNFQVTTTTQPIVNGEWAVYAFRYSAATGTMQVFKNNVSIATITSVPAHGDIFLPFSMIGWGPYASLYLTGDIRSFRVWDRALSDTELTAQYTGLTQWLPVIPRGPGNWYAATPGGKTLLDVSQLSASPVSSWGAPIAFAQATTAQQPTYVSSGGYGGLGYVSFNSANAQYLNAGTQTFNLATNGGFTAIVHMRKTSVSVVGERVFDFSNQISMAIVGALIQVKVGTNVTQTVGAATAVVTNEWAVFAMRYTASTATLALYKNNVLVASTGSVLAASNVTVNVAAIGSSDSFAGVPRWLQGDIRALMVHDRALSDAELAGVYAQLTQTTSLTNWYRAETALTHVDGRVAQWDDLSGGGRHAVQATAANRPAARLEFAMRGKYPMVWFGEEPAVAQTSAVGTGGYVVTASSQTFGTGDYGAWRAFDKMVPGGGGGAGQWVTTTTSGIEWLVLQMPRAIVLGSYSITARDQTQELTSSPKLWVVEGSLDGVNWTVVDDRTGTPQTAWTSLEVRTFTLSPTPTVAYTYYRLYITSSINGTTGRYGFSEWRLWPANDAWALLAPGPNSTQFTIAMVMSASLGTLQPSARVWSMPEVRLFYSGTLSIVDSAANNVLVNFATLTQGQPCIIIVTGTTDGTTGTVIPYTNGVQASGTATTAAATFGLSGLVLGNSPLTGVQYGTPRPLNGGISTCMVYNTVLGTSDRQKLEGYLAWTWWDSGSAILPAGHPYYSAVPT